VSSTLRNPLCWLGILIVSVSTIMLASGLYRRQELRTFLASNVVIMGILAIGEAAVFPVMLYSTLAPQYSLSAYTVAASHGTLVLGLFWWPVGFALAITYFVFISRRYAGKVSITSRLLKK
jgi:cytochrome bd ubiquinol oxidase subunit II